MTRTYKNGESFSIETEMSFGDIIRQGRIWSPPPGGYPRRPFSVAVVGLTWHEAERYGNKLPYAEGELFFLTPEFDPSKYVWFRFDHAYVVADLMPELRTEDEQEWFAQFERQLNPGARVIYFSE